MTMTSVTDLGKVENEKEIVSGLRLKLRTLSAKEYAHIMQFSKDLAGSMEHPTMETLGKLAEVQIETLAWATVAINGDTYAGLDRYTRLQAFYQNLQYPVLMEAYRAYLDLLGQQNNAMDELKKNLTTPLSVMTT